MSCPISPLKNISAPPDNTEAGEPLSPEGLFVVFKHLNINYTLHHHKPLFTVADGLKIEAGIPGRHNRNLFIRDKRERMFLVSALNETKIDLKKLAPAIGADRFSFGSPERLWARLGVKPGSVCPFAIINDTDKMVTPVLDAEMMRQDLINFHPLINTMTVGVAPAGLLAFYAHIGRDPVILEMGPIAPDKE